MSTTENSSNSSAGGNTKPPREKGVKQCSPAKRWCFTWNNYPEDWVNQLQFQSSKILGYVVGRETAPTTGTQHLQGYMEFREKLRPKNLFPTEIHWSVAKGNKEQNIAYCTKEGKFEAWGSCRVQVIKTFDVPFPWQSEVIKLVQEQPDDRKIHWFWEQTGCTGKSALVKHLAVHHGAMICSGKASDMKYMIVKYKENTGLWPELVVFDIPRTYQDFLCYQGIEEIKNGCFASTKYDCQQVTMPNPHVLIFANNPPILSNFSADRWVVREIINRELVYLLRGTYGPPPRFARAPPSLTRGGCPRASRSGVSRAARALDNN